MNYLKRLFNLTVALAILISIPYLFGWGLIFVSWLPALVALMYIDDL